ncbi:MAG: phenylalanine--tRNA ligase subunit beta [Planctomycetota bacterium]|nr:phenylalanine--tRNA ligase subunit beta [Planctomycetota bacterium]
MKVSLAWINEYLRPAVAADEAESLLTAQGMPIETRTPLTSGGANGDEMLDVEVTSNRADCLSHVGVAREIAAGSGRTFTMPATAIPPEAQSSEPVSSLTSVENRRPDLCPGYTARVIRGVRVGASPAWLKARLEAIGLRSVNNVVDVTNFVLMELGQPLHAFDLAKLAERRIVVRHAQKGETMTAIDGAKLTLTPEMLVIADAKRPVAIAGVMGGLDSEVNMGTTDILLESARFDPLTTRRTGRSLKLASDSSYRFERGIDPAGLDRASQRAAALIVQVAGGKIASGVVSVGSAAPGPRAVSLRVARCKALLGIDIPAARMVELLERLGLSPKLDARGETIACSVPTYRPDLEREVDLIEEVARLHGLDHLGVKQKIEIIARPVQPNVEARRRLGQSLASHGYHETVTFSFLPPKLGEAFLSEGRTPVMVDDERRKTEPLLRPSLLPSLMLCRKANQDVGNTNVRLFETAATWWREAGKIVERRRLALVADAADAQLAVRDLRGTLEELASVLAGSADLEIVPASHAAFSAAAVVKLAGREVGHMGLIAPAVLKLADLQAPVVAAELDLEAWLEAYPPVRQVSQLARHPGIERDLSVVVDEAVAWDQIRREVLATSPALLERVNFLIAYRGKPISAGKKSVSFRMLFRDPEATLRHEQVDPQVGTVVARLKEKLGAELRA